MRRLISNNITSAIAVLSAISLFLGVAALRQPDLNGWMTRNPAWGWGLALAFLFALGVFVVMWNRAEDANDAKDEEIADLRNRLRQPTIHDDELFEEVVTTFPWNEGVVNWLDTSFDATYWSAAKFDALAEANDKWVHSVFDDPVVQEAFKSFRSALFALINWMSNAGRYWEHWNQNVTSPSEIMYRVPNPDNDATASALNDTRSEHEQWKVFERTQKQGFDSAKEFLEQFESFERVARRRGLGGSREVLE